MTVRDVALPSGSDDGGRERARGLTRTRARLADAEGDGKILVFPGSACAQAPAEAVPNADEEASPRAGWIARIRSGATVVRADFAASFMANGRPPSLKELWQARKPPLARVPGQSVALHRSWIAFNCLALVFAVVLYPALYVLAHPARLAVVILLGALLWGIWAHPYS